MSSKTTEITIDGISYIPVKEAAYLAEYTPDYVGQLCRAGKLEATRVGRAWYVSESSIIAHKEAQLLSEEKAEDSEEETVSIQEPKRFISPKTIFKESSLLVYHKDESPLLPTLKPRVQSNKEETELHSSVDVASRETEIIHKEPKTEPRKQTPVLLPVRKLPTLIARYIGTIGAALGRALLVTTSFAIVFLLIFSLNGSYTRSLIGDAFGGAVANVAESEVASTVESDLFEPFEYAATAFAERIDETVFNFVYGDKIYDAGVRR